MNQAKHNENETETDKKAIHQRVILKPGSQ
jgi:hypothetical protein